MSFTPTAVTHERKGQGFEWWERSHLVGRGVRCMSGAIHCDRRSAGKQHRRPMPMWSESRFRYASSDAMSTFWRRNVFLARGSTCLLLNVSRFDVRTQCPDPLRRVQVVCGPVWP